VASGAGTSAQLTSSTVIELARQRRPVRRWPRGGSGIGFVHSDGGSSNVRAILGPGVDGREEYDGGPGTPVCVPESTIAGELGLGSGVEAQGTGAAAIVRGVGDGVETCAARVSGAGRRS
jgi:hypothetical protein